MRREDRRHVSAFGVLILLVAGLYSSAAALSPASRAQAQDARPAGSVLDGVFTSAQASAGEQQFQQECAACHTVSEHTGANFTGKWAGTTLNDLFELISNTMPESEPGRLKPAEYASIVAFFLKQTGYPEGQQELPSDIAALTKIRVEPLAK